MFKHFSDSTFKKLKKTSMNQSYCSLNKKKYVFQNVQKYSIDRELSKKLEDAPYSVIPYGCIEGVIYPAGATLKSNFNLEKEGVMQHTSLVEHKSRRVQGIWYFIVLFFHLLLIIVIVQNYHFCHIWTILNKSYNLN